MHRAQASVQMPAVLAISSAALFHCQVQGQIYLITHVITVSTISNYSTVPGSQPGPAYRERINTENREKYAKRTFGHVRISVVLRRVPAWHWLKPLGPAFFQNKVVGSYTICLKRSFHI